MSATKWWQWTSRELPTKIVTSHSMAWLRQVKVQEESASIIVRLLQALPHWKGWPQEGAGLLMTIIRSSGSSASYVQFLKLMKLSNVSGWAQCLTVHSSHFSCTRPQALILQQLYCAWASGQPECRPWVMNSLLKSLAGSPWSLTLCCSSN